MARLRLGTMKEYVLDSFYLQEKMPIKVYTPEHFSTEKKYNIFIAHDGDHYFQIGRLATLSDEFHQTNQIEPTVFVGIHFIDRQDRRKKYHPDGVKNKAYTNFLVFEVVPFLDKIIPSTQEGNSRTLAGDSLAGTLALMTAEKFPNVFRRVIMQSPYVNETVIDRLKNSKSLSLLDIYHTIGTDELAVETTDGKTMDFVTPNRAIHQLISQSKASYIYEEIGGGNHTWKYWQGDLRKAILQMFTK